MSENNFIHMGMTLLKFYIWCGSKIKSFPKRMSFTLGYMSLM